MSAAIELRNVSISFFGEDLLKDVSLSIERGERFVLIGPSGMGKTVLLKLMAGLLVPSKGEVLLNGKNLALLSSSEKEKCMQGIGMLFQKNALFDSLRVGENIAFPLQETTELSSVEIEQKVDFFLEAVGISHAKALFPDEISGGMQKRLGIARALALQPDMVFYDDPTAGLDPITSRRIIDLILSLSEQNKSTVVAVTNDMNRAYQLGHRVGLVADHQLIIAGDIKQTKSSLDPRVQQFINGKLQGPLTSSGELAIVE